MPLGEIRPIHNFSGLFTLEANPTPRLVLYLNYGGDYAAANGLRLAGATTTLAAPSPCFAAIRPAHGLPEYLGQADLPHYLTAAQLAAGTWGATWAAPSNGGRGLRLAVAQQLILQYHRSPGYNGGGSTGYIPGGSCGAQTRDLQEATGGWWYDIYKGDRGRFRQGFQYSYAVREGWSGASGIGAKGIDNMFWTSLRYYLP